MTTSNHGLGRRASPDERDRKYMLVRRLGAPGAPVPVRKTWRITSRALNQMATGTCVGHAWSNFLRCEPLQTTGKSAPTPFDIYRKAVTLDVWSENDGEAAAPEDQLQFGTSVRAGAEAVTSTGRLKTYLWAFSLQPALEFVLTQGPVVLGTDWPDSYMRPDAEGIVRITPSTKFIGGHAYLWRGADTKRGLATCENSWGDGYARSGSFYVPLRDLERLILQAGEVCTATETRLKPA